MKLARYVLAFAVALPALAADPDFYARKGVAIRGADPVAYFTLAEGADAAIGDSAITASYGGTTWRFVSTANRDAFVADPERYLPQYGGYCAYAVASGYTAKIDPDAWHITDGKLYLNYSKRIGRRWLRDRDSYISSADANWPDVLAACEAKDRCAD